MTDYEFHPLAQDYDLLEGEPFDELCDSVKTQGLDEAIVLYEGKILDGRNRQRACDDTGTTPRYREWDDEGGTRSPALYVWNKNFHRRHLTPGEKATCVVAFEEELEREAKGRQKAAGVARGPQVCPNFLRWTCQMTPPTKPSS